MSTPSALWDSSLSGVSKPELHRYRPNKEPKLTLHSRRLSPAAVFTAPNRTTTTINNDNETKKKIIVRTFLLHKSSQRKACRAIRTLDPDHFSHFKV